MISIHRSYVIFVCMALISFGRVAHAHNLFVLVQPQSSGPDHINIIFEHAPRPGKGTYNRPILNRGKTMIYQPNSEKGISLNLKEMNVRSKKYLRTESDIQGPRLIVHSCKWGIYKGRLDYFHGKYLDVSTPEEAEGLAKVSELPLDIVPTIEADGLALQVFYQEKPLAKQKIWIWLPSRKETRKKTDASGILRLKNLQPGTWSFATTHTLRNKTGKFNGKAYKGIMHGTTLSIRWPLKLKAAPK